MSSKSRGSSQSRESRDERGSSDPKGLTAGQSTQPPTGSGGGRGPAGLGLGIVGLILVWLVVLPWLGQRPGVRRHIERNQRYGIQADAMFYTEVGPVRGLRLRWVDGEYVRETFQVGHSNDAEIPRAKHDQPAR